MDIQAKKLELIQWLAGVNDPLLISRFVQLKDSTAEEEEVQILASIERGLKDIGIGRTKEHSEIKKKYDKWL